MFETASYPIVDRGNRDAVASLHRRMAASPSSSDAAPGTTRTPAPSGVDGDVDEAGRCDPGGAEHLQIVRPFGHERCVGGEAGDSFIIGVVMDEEHTHLRASKCGEGGADAVGRSGCAAGLLSERFEELDGRLGRDRTEKRRDVTVPSIFRAVGGKINRPDAPGRSGMCSLNVDLQAWRRRSVHYSTNR